MKANVFKHTITADKAFFGLFSGGLEAHTLQFSCAFKGQHILIRIDGDIFHPPPLVAGNGISGQVKHGDDCQIVDHASQIDGLLNGRVPAADDDNILVSIRSAVADCTPADAVSGKLILSLAVQVIGLCSGGNDDGAGGIDLIILFAVDLLYIPRSLIEVTVR